MNILTASQTHDLDRATQAEQQITALALMERSAQALLHWIEQHLNNPRPTDTLILCGPGNNGGDGLALARLLYKAGYAVRVALLPDSKYSAGYEQNLKQLPKKLKPESLATNALPEITPDTLVVDALFGTGLRLALSGLAASLARHINASGARVLAVDVPSGLLCDIPQVDPSAPIVQATYTVSFGLPKLAFMLPQNAQYVGEWYVEDIGLSAEFILQSDTPWHLTVLPTDSTFPQYRSPKERVYLPKREKFAYKNVFGHALLLAGSRGKLGAAVLAAGACLHGGVGLLTVAVPGCGYAIMQSTRPEAMCLPDPQADYLTELPDLTPYQAVGIGPGLGQHPASLALLKKLLHAARQANLPLVLDADALNLLGEHRELLELLPETTVLTPHVGEFARLTKEVEDDYDRLQLLREFAQQHKCWVVLKGAYSAVAAPDGQVYFNSTGNPGMATGGSGDALTGLVLALLADKRLLPLTAVRLAVLAHGLAGDLAAAHIGEAGLVAGDVIRHIGPALQKITC